MLFGIKMFENKKGLKRANESLQRYGSAIMFSGKNMGIFFTNPLVALKVAYRLTQKRQLLTYKVYKLSKWEECGIDKECIVNNYEEYKQLTNKQIKEADELLNKLLQERGLPIIETKEENEIEK